MCLFGFPRLPKQDYPDAQCQLGKMYRMGRGVAQDNEQVAEGLYEERRVQIPVRP